MTAWLIETLVWTGLLIGLVLVLRRPVGSYFGPKAAYALWALPFLRLFMPPLVLPAWLAPAVPAVQQTFPQHAQYTVYTAELAKIPAGQAAIVAPDAMALPGLGAAILLAVWLTGAAIFLGFRFFGYFTMRRTLLEGGCPVGEAGRVRLVETPAATAPVAFGVIDKVIALPPGFMALYDRKQRDFVLAHELAHHSGRDLLANMAAQPLFALHWFNPLAWLGWRAMRRDQEAACDARVIARRSAADKAVYAETIASFAAGPRVSLAAPMACPVLGEKSIIHRLRSISMSDISPRRRFAGRALIGASLLALPLTASISYAETLVQPALPEAPPAPPPAMAAPQAPEAPVPPAPPQAPEAPVPPAPRAFEREIKTVGSDGRQRKIVIIEREMDAGETKTITKHRKQVHLGSGDRKLSQAEREELDRDLAEAMADVDKAVAEAQQERRIAVMEIRNAEGQMTKLRVDCSDAKKDAKQAGKHQSAGQKDSSLCVSEVYAQAFTGLKEARKAIASNREMSGEMRAKVLAALDEKITEWKKK